MEGSVAVAQGHRLRSPADYALMVQCHPVGEPAPAVVTNHGESPVAQLRNELDELCRHSPFRGRRQSICRRWRQRALTVPGKVGEDQSVGAGKGGGDQMPHDMGLRMAVQEKDGIARATGADPEPAPTHLHPEYFKTLEHHRILLFGSTSDNRFIKVPPRVTNGLKVP